MVTLHHVLLVTWAFLPAMIDGGGGSIVNVHSVEGLRGFPGEPVYAAMKAAVAHFTTSLAAGYGRFGIRANGIGPDLTQTPQVDYLTGYEDYEHLWESWAPVGRLGRPEDQARVALFLATRPGVVRHGGQHSRRRRRARWGRLVLLVVGGPLRKPPHRPVEAER